MIINRYGKVNYYAGMAELGQLLWRGHMRRVSKRVLFARKTQDPVP